MTTTSTTPGSAAAGTTTDGPLAGLRVVETGSLIAGPFCAQLLGDFGAEIIKIEDPGAGDPMRQWGSCRPSGHSLSWPIIARNKKSVTCNLRSPEGQEILRGLAERADVVVENFRPGTMERWGCGYEDLSRTNPGIIMTRVTGYGQTGPYAQRAGFGVIGEAMGGIRHLTGEPGRPTGRIGVSLGDSLAGTFAALGTVMAVVGRQRTGVGQVVDSAIYEAVLALMEASLPEWELAGFQRERSGSTLPGVAPSNVYPTRDGAEVLIAGNRDTVFRRLASVLGREDWLDDDRFATHGARGEHGAELDALIGAITATRDSAALLDALHDAGVPAGLAYRSEDMLRDPHFAARQAIVRLTHPALGPFPMQNVVPQLSGTPGRVGSLGPELGEHTDAVLSSVLGLDDARIAELRARGVV
ncbi:MULTISPECIES: CoA transferase [unclassified Pseudonocardia]|uniref:CaiB/BaiF CoA transferase family protein n=1 Tax=unclassified Pseudonocardia TaxID=2619320 RepID=UPI0001FFF1A7|nr:MULTISPECIES: CoA transferase [unclassified Pseudonocardia]ALL78018.1 CoA-transferase [Pseudonocardia sp. EC080610-09]ALL80931.1 CoA-transferase [Pseudonocardia sp. EC080619-01]OLM17054.1 L-carnitine dehydratase/bile acid-inducible protein F [Pseudonocardia sp. Ae707_Ps1]